MRKIILLLFLFLGLVLTTVTAHAQDGEIYVLEIDGPVTPTMAGYFERGIEEAEAANAEAVLIILDTPGGAVTTTTEIVQIFRGAGVPVIVYIGPRGAQAASAGSVITAAAHVAAMAPETVIGAASPINSDGSDINETAYRKAVEDLKATMRGLTERRGEEAVALGEAMIEEARAVHSNEALEAGFIDVIAVDVDDLLAQLDGQKVTVNDEVQTLETAAITRTNVPLTSIEQLLFLLSNPILIGILLTIGVQAILIELSNPGGFLAGLIGVICLGLALYGAGQLPVNWLGLGLIVLAFILFVMEVTTATTGALAVAGTLTLLGGLLVLFNSPGTPEFARISLAAAIAISLVTAAFFIFILTMALRAQRAQPTTGVEGLVGQIGTVRKTLTATAPEAPYTGMALVNGELWQVRANESIENGEKVMVTAVEGFTLHVQKYTLKTAEKMKMNPSPQAEN